MMIQDIAPYKFNNQYINKEEKDSDIVLAFGEQGILINEEKENVFPSVHIYRKKYINEELIYLFSVDDTSYYMAPVGSNVLLDDYSEYKKLNELRKTLKKPEIMVAATGLHLYMWYRDNAYCGRCGKKTHHDKKLRCLVCECKNMIFPRISPAVIVAVTNKNKILLTKYANRAYTRYALIAGFTEIGETLEETVRREVLEEAGVNVKNIKYYKSQPWGFDGNILAGFFCELDGDDTITMDAEELATAEWVTKEDIPEYNEGLALTHEMMQVFKNS